MDNMNYYANKRLDSREKIREIDEDNVLGSVEDLHKQCSDAWEKASKVEVPESYKQFDHVIMTGMGGSGLGARVIQSVYFDQIQAPLVRINNYHLPPYAGESSLVIVSSYSGNTEEAVQTALEAIEKNSKWIAIGTGGKLGEIAEEHSVPYYKIDPIYNPSNQPRMAIGYSVIGQLVLTSKTGLFDLHKSDVDELVTVMKDVVRRYKPEVRYSENAAKQQASKLHGKNVFYISADHLTGAMHTVNNQLNENAKAFSGDFQIPELNHHLLEGMKHPSVNSDNIFMFFANSTLYSEKIKKRFTVTVDIVNKHDIDIYEYVCASENKLSQAFELIQFGAFINLYLSILYGQNPAPIPWVDYFKEELKG